MSTTTEVVVVGGGYAGVTAANRMSGRRDVAVTLVDPHPAFVERIRLHQLAARTGDASVPFDRVLSPRVRRVQDTVTLIDRESRTVASASEGAIGYDHLVLAVGSGAADGGVPGVREHAHPIATWDSAARLRAALDGLRRGDAVTIVGAGPAGIETAAELAERDFRVTLVCGSALGPSLHPRTRRTVRDRLARLGTTVLEGEGARAVAVEADAVHLADGRAVPGAVTVWAAGFGVPDLADRSGLAVDALGRLRTDETLTSVDDERVVGAGDAVTPSDLPFRMSCQAAGQLGGGAADTVLSRIAGRTPEPVVVGFAGLCLSLGRRAGVMQLEHRDDTPRGVQIAGSAGGALKELICRGTVAGLQWEARRPGSTRAPRFVADPGRRRLLEERRSGATEAARG